MNDELAYRSLEELGAGLARKDFSSRELVQAYLARIERGNGKLHAYVDVYRDEAIAAAESADRQRAAGLVLSPLHGLPIALKDLCDIGGKVGQVGSKAWATRKATVTASIVERLVSAGMVLLGKTHMVEFAFGGWGTNPLCGAPWNPWDLATHRVPGGSSSGSGVAVAAGLAPAAIGSDTGGSVRIPAAFNGIVGLKTTFGLISLHGCFPLSSTLDTIGPMTRTVADAALLTQALAGPDPRDPGTLAAPAFRMPDLQAPNVRGMRVAMLPESQYPPGVDPSVVQATREAARALRELGVSVEERMFPFDMAELVVRNGQLIAAEGYAVHRAYIEDESQAIGKFVRQRMLAGKSVTAADYVLAREHQRRSSAQFVDWMEDSDALLMPGAATPAIALNEVDEAIAPSGFTRAGNYLTACGLSVPAGFSPQGLPVGVQFIGKPFGERTVLRIGAAFERATGFSRKTPDLRALFK